MRAFIFRICGFIICVLGIFLHLIANNFVEEGFMVQHQFAYFTLQTNIFIGLIFLVLIIKTLKVKRKENKLIVAHINPSLHLACVLYITITMMGFWFVLAPLTGVPVNKFLFFNTLILHTITPIMAILDYVLYAKHDILKYSEFKKWLVYPFIYLIFVMIYSRFIKIPYYSFKMNNQVINLMYPYPFLDPQIMGIQGIIIAILLLVLFFILLSILFIYINNKILNKLK